jgi:hypothetical protein
MTAVGHDMLKAFRHQVFLSEGKVVVRRLLFHCEGDMSHWLQRGSGCRVAALGGSAPPIRIEALQIVIHLLVNGLSCSMHRNALVRHEK